MTRKIYVSGPITGLELEAAKGRFRAAELELLSRGFEVVNPFNVDPPHVACDGATQLHTWSCYVKHDLVAMLDCDSIVMLPGWERSHGARLELLVASTCGLDVFPSMSTVPYA